MKRYFLSLLTFCQLCGIPGYAYFEYYVGLNTGGYRESTYPQVSIPAPSAYFFGNDLPQINSAGAFHLNSYCFVGGAQTGINCHFNHCWLGLETDFGAFLTDRSHAITETFISVPTSQFTIYQKVSTDWLYTLRPRLGIECGRWLIFATGGLAVTNLKYRGIFTDDVLAGTFDQVILHKVRPGPVLGGGVEYEYSSSLSLNCTWLYTSFKYIDKESRFIGGGVSEAVLAYRGNLKANVVRLGLNWKFR